MSKQQGFSLIELMIVVVIVGILAAVGIPSYQNHIARGNRAAAQAFMLDIANREKQYLLDARNYTSDLAVLFGTPASAAAVPADVIRHYASISIAVSSAPPTFTITATPTSSQQASDGALSLDSAGNKTLHGNPGW